MTAIPDIERPLRLGQLGLALLTLVCSAAFPAWADDEAQANRLMVEAVGLIAAAEDAPSAVERLRLLRTAHERLTEIVRRLPSTDLAMRLATGQQIGSVSLAELRKALEDAQTVAEAAPPVRTAPAKPGAPVQAWRHDAAVVAVGWTSGDQRLSAARREWVATVSSRPRRNRRSSGCRSGPTPGLGAASSPAVAQRTRPPLVGWRRETRRRWSGSGQPSPQLPVDRTTKHLGKPTYGLCVVAPETYP